MIGKVVEKGYITTVEEKAAKPPNYKPIMIT